MQSRRALVIGCGGALGTSVVNALLSSQWDVCGVDVKPIPAAPYAYRSLRADGPVGQYQEELLNFVSSRKLNAIINVSGGWAGATIADKSMAASSQVMLQQSLYTSLAAAHIFASCGAEGSLLVLTGAAAAMSPTPSMIPYGVAKSAVHFLCKSIASDPAQMPEHSRVVTLMPWTIDTPANRSAMPDADMSSWTPSSDIAGYISQWCQGNSVPENGSLVELMTTNGKTTTRIH